MNLRTIIIESNTVIMLQSGSHAILRIQDQVEEFCRSECNRLIKKALKLKTRTPPSHSYLAVLPAWQQVCAKACEAEFQRYADRVISA